MVHKHPAWQPRPAAPGFPPKQGLACASEMNLRTLSMSIAVRCVRYTEGEVPNRTGTEGKNERSRAQHSMQSHARNNGAHRTLPNTCSSTQPPASRRGRPAKGSGLARVREILSGWLQRGRERRYLPAAETEAAVWRDAGACCLGRPCSLRHAHWREQPIRQADGRVRRARALAAATPAAAAAAATRCRRPGMRRCTKAARVPGQPCLSCQQCAHLIPLAGLLGAAGVSRQGRLPAHEFLRRGEAGCPPPCQFASRAAAFPMLLGLLTPSLLASLYSHAGFLHGHQPAQHPDCKHDRRLLRPVRRAAQLR